MTFPRVKPLGWALYELLTSSQMTQLDINASKAADSTYVKDYGAALTFQKSIPVATWNRHSTSIYIPKTNTWLGVSIGGCVRVVGAAGLVVASSTFPLTLNQMLSGGIAYDGNDTIVAGGGVSTAIATKILRASVAGNADVWTAQNVAVAEFGAVSALGWFAAASKFVAGILGCGVDSSPDGITWTRRSSNPQSWRKVAFSNTIAVIVNGAGGTSSTNYMTSTDAVTWTTRTLPIEASSGWRGVVYSKVDGTFLIVGNGSEQWLRSPDGINWTAFTPSFAASIPNTINPAFIECLGPLYLMAYSFTGGSGIAGSVDKGATWIPLLQTGAASAQTLAASDGQVLFCDADNANFSNLLSL